jgi:hypothetical protein
MTSEPDSQTEYAALDKNVPLCLLRRQTIRGQPQALVVTIPTVLSLYSHYPLTVLSPQRWKPGWTSATDAADPVFDTVDAVIQRAKDRTLVRWKVPFRPTYCFTTRFTALFLFLGYLGSVGRRVLGGRETQCSGGLSCRGC